MKTTILTIALALATMPLTFAAQTPAPTAPAAPAATKPAATAPVKTTKRHHVKASKKTVKTVPSSATPAPVK